VQFVPRADGSYEFIASSGSIRDIRGIIKRDGPAPTLEEMDEAVADMAAERYLDR
jgi:hypothetical protein